MGYMWSINRDHNRLRGSRDRENPDAVLRTLMRAPCSAPDLESVAFSFLVHWEIPRRV